METKQKTAYDHSGKIIHDSNIINYHLYSVDRNFNGSLWYELLFVSLSMHTFYIELLPTFRSNPQQAIEPQQTIERRRCNIKGHKFNDYHCVNEYFLRFTFYSFTHNILYLLYYLPKQERAGIHNYNYT